ncbi:MAG: sigma-70 family RNA polymerase sigma factor [Planctomycetota bacterium]
MTLMHDPMSPLAQVRRNRGGELSMRPSKRSLSARDVRRARRLLDEKYEFIPFEELGLSDDEAERVLFTEAEEVPKPDTSWYHPVLDSYSPASQDSLRPKAGTIVLTASQERTLFKQFNYYRYRVCRYRDDLKLQAELDPDATRSMLDWHAKAERFREQIANTNLALVLAMAKRTRMSEVDFADMISEGNMALLRAVDKFDASRGFKFSTYACRAIIKAFSRQGIKLSKHRAMFPTDFDPKLERSNHQELKRAEHEDDCVDEVGRIFRDNTAELSQMELEVLDHRFALSDEKKVTDAKPLTLEQVGRLIGVTKERVRQIQNKALDKIRQQVEGEFLG